MTQGCQPHADGDMTAGVRGFGGDAGLTQVLPKWEQWLGRDLVPPHGRVGAGTSPWGHWPLKLAKRPRGLTQPETALRVGAGCVLLVLPSIPQVFKCPLKGPRPDSLPLTWIRSLKLYICPLLPCLFLCACRDTAPSWKLDPCFCRPSLPLHTPGTRGTLPPMAC